MKNQNEEIIGLLPLAKLMAANRATASTFDDVYCDAVFGLTKAVAEFDPKRSSNLSKFAAARIGHAIYDGYQSRNGATVRLNQDLRGETREPDDSDAFAVARDVLPCRHFELIEMRFKHGKSVEEIVDLTGESRRRVLEVQKQAVEALQRSREFREVANEC